MAGTGGRQAAGITLDLRLAVTAADAAHDTYEIPIEAAGAYVTARFHVHLPKVSLAFQVVDEDPKSLAKTVEIKNSGDTLSVPSGSGRERSALSGG